MATAMVVYSKPAFPRLDPSVAPPPPPRFPASKLPPAAQAAIVRLPPTTATAEAHPALDTMYEEPGVPRAPEPLYETLDLTRGFPAMAAAIEAQEQAGESGGALADLTATTEVAYVPLAVAVAKMRGMLAEMMQLKAHCGDVVGELEQQMREQATCARAALEQQAVRMHGEHMEREAALRSVIAQYQREVDSASAEWERGIALLVVEKQRLAEQALRDHALTEQVHKEQLLAEVDAHATALAALAVSHALEGDAQREAHAAEVEALTLAHNTAETALQWTRASMFLGQALHAGSQNVLRRLAAVPRDCRHQWVSECRQTEAVRHTAALQRHDKLSSELKEWERVFQEKHRRAPSTPQDLLAIQPLKDGVWAAELELATCDGAVEALDLAEGRAAAPATTELATPLAAYALRSDNAAAAVGMDTASPTAGPQHLSPTRLSFGAPASVSASPHAVALSAGAARAVPLEAVAALQSLQSLQFELAQERNLRKAYFLTISQMRGQLRVVALVRSRTAAAATTVVGGDHPLRACLSAPDAHTLCAVDGGGHTQEFVFDRVLLNPTPAKVRDTLADTLADVAVSVAAGAEGAVIAYGPDDAGKSATMWGSPEAGSDEYAHAGVVHTLLPLLLARAADRGGVVTGRLLGVGDAGVRDLLRASHLTDVTAPVLTVVRTDRVRVPGGAEVPLESVADCRPILQAALDACAQLHVVFTATVWSTEGQREIGQLWVASVAGAPLDGSAAHVALGAVLSARGATQRHVPYGAHRLTQLLQDALGGRPCATSLLVCTQQLGLNTEIGAEADVHAAVAGPLARTLATLAFAARAKQIVCHPQPGHL